MRRLLQGIDAGQEQRTHLVWWSRFRRAHQARAKQSHSQRRTCQAPPIAPLHTQPLPILLPGLPLLTDALWNQLRPLFEPAQLKRGRQTQQWRRRLEAVLWVARTASAWRQLPEVFGPWETVVYHYRRWCKGGLWERVVQILLPHSASHVPPLAHADLLDQLAHMTSLPGCSTTALVHWAQQDGLRVPPTVTSYSPAHPSPLTVDVSPVLAGMLQA